MALSLLSFLSPFSIILSDGLFSIELLHCQSSTFLIKSHTGGDIKSLGTEIVFHALSCFRKGSSGKLCEFGFQLVDLLEWGHRAGLCHPGQWAVGSESSHVWMYTPWFMGLEVQRTCPFYPLWALAQTWLHSSGSLFTSDFIGNPLLPPLCDIFFLFYFSFPVIFPFGI